MVIAIRGGHSSKAPGAVGIVNEYEEMQALYISLERMLTATGHTVQNCNSFEAVQNADLLHGVTVANTPTRADLFISLHMNASQSHRGDGVECWTISEKSKSNVYAEKIVENIAALGFDSRGVKHKRYFELRETEMPAIIVETLFCDNHQDVKTYKEIGVDALAAAITISINSVQGAING